ncbi:MAG: acetyltransferase [Planctomycetota bacterium]|jgi:sugar O-acyltransferase (sialic acid O-acetyltransferase NeuD family)
MINLIILGAGGHAKEVFSTIEDINILHPIKKYNIVGFFDDITARVELFGIMVFKNIDDIKDRSIRVVLGVGTPQTKSVFITKFKKKAFLFETIIHPTSYVSEYTSIGCGAVVQSHCILQPDVHIGDYFTCNDNVQIGHDTVIGDNVHINSNVNIAGGAQIGDNSFLGVKATIFRVTIGKNCIIGACSLVNKNVPDNSKAMGVPLKYVPSDGKISF